MKTIAIVGSQWGDEGKGKITDLLGPKAELGCQLSGWQQRRTYDYRRK